MRAVLYDPVTPFIKEAVDNAAIDTYFEYCVIRKEFLDKNFPTIKKLEPLSIVVSHGMEIQAPAVKIGVQVGNRASSNVQCYVFDKGPYDFIIGKNFLIQSLTVIDGESEYKSYSVFDEKNNPELLTVELYCVEGDVQAIFL